MSARRTAAVRRRLILVVVAMLAMGCISTPLGPSQQGPLRLRGEITQSTIPAGGTAMLRFRLENTGAQPIVLTFPSSCRIRPFVTDRAPGQVVHPPGGEWVCLAVITNLEVPAHGAVIEEVHLSAGQPGAPVVVVLPPGNYEASARVDAMSVSLRSDPVSFTVR
jgi:hypothetical protein